VLGRSDQAEKDGWDDEALAAANRPERPGQEELGFETLGASAQLDQVIFDGTAFGTGAEPGTAEEEDYLGLPGLLEPDQVALLLRQRQARQLEEQKRRKAAQPAVGTVSAPPPPRRSVSVHERRAQLRRELNGLVAAHHHRTGKPHGMIHAELRKACGGPPTATASTEELEQRIATIRSW
jgi:hypothetical protein